MKTKIKFMSSSTVVVALLSGLLFWEGCKKKEDTQPTNTTTTTQSVIIPPTTKIVEQKEQPNLISVDSSQLVFSGSSATAGKVAVGDIIVSGISTKSPEGFLRKVTAVQNTGGQIVLQTTDASLSEAIQQGSVSIHKAFTDADIVGVDSFGKTHSVSFTVNIDKVLYDADGNKNTTLDQIKATGTVSIEPNFDFSADISNFHLNKLLLQLGIKNTSTIKITAGGNIALTDQLQFDLISYKLTPIVIWAGIVPIVLVPNLVLSVGLDGQISASITTGVSTVSSATAGLKYENSKWNTIAEKNASFTYIPPTFALDASFRGFTEPRLDIRLYDQKKIRASVNIDGYLKFVVTPLQTPVWNLYGGVEAKGEVFMKIFDITMADVNMNIFTWEKLIASEAVTTPTIPVLTTSAVSAITPTTAQCGGSITNDGGSSITARGVCWSSTNTNPTTADNKTSDGTGTGSFTSNLTGLAANTTYYVRAYSTNSTGTGYGTALTFTTLQNTSSVPVLTTIAVSAITQTTAQCGGTITNDGGSSITARGVCWSSTNANPTTADNKTNDGTGTGSFTSNITGLTANTTYYVRAYSTNSTGTGYGTAMTFTTLKNNTGTTVTDIDGNTYNTVTIGTQAWLTENLKATKYNDGTAIPLVTDSAAWDNLTTPGYSWYNNDAATYKNTYGALYNWYTVNTAKLCPSGWHVPTDAEWTTLETYLGGSSVAGGKLKEAGTAHWRSPNTGATNSSGFSALPGGYRNTVASFLDIGDFGYWWSSTEVSTTYAWYRHMYYFGSFVGRSIYYARKNSGISVRCVRD